MMTISKKTLKSPLELCMKAVDRANNYESVMIIGITRDKLDKDVMIFSSDLKFHLMAAVVNMISVEVAAGRIKL